MGSWGVIAQRWCGRGKLDFVDAASVLRGGQLMASDGGGDRAESGDRSADSKFGCKLAIVRDVRSQCMGDISVVVVVGNGWFVFLGGSCAGGRVAASSTID